MKELLKNKKYMTMMGGAIIVVIIIVVMMNMSGNKQIMQGTSDNASKEEIKERLENKADASILAASINTELIFETGESKATFNIENLPENTYDIKVQIIVRDKIEEIIYESGMLKPGYIVKEDQLSKTLEKGEYACIARFIGYDKEGNQAKTVDAQINIIVEN